MLGKALNFETGGSILLAHRQHHSRPFNSFIIYWTRVYGNKSDCMRWVHSNPHLWDHGTIL